MGKRGWRWVACTWIVATLAGCSHDATAENSSEKAAKPAAQAEPARDREAKPDVEAEGLLIGFHRPAANPIIDGDTIRLEGIEGSIRLLSIDTEERFHGEAERRAATKDFDAYLKKRRGDSKRPLKPGTPLGEQAAEFARAFFDGADTVRLERDDPKEIRGRFGRLLAYALVQKDGRWTTYNVEAVRAGMSPYFTKYGYSHRLHNDLLDAEAEARKAKRGIWNPETKGYGDYDERKAWWNARADFIRAFEHEATGRSDRVLLSHWDARERLEASLGKEVAVMSTVDRVQHFKGLVRVSLAMTSGKMFPVIFFDKGVFEKSGIADYVREPVSVRGKVTLYEKGSYRTLQIVVDDPGQITLPKLPSPD